jgi:flavin-dependent dehydrogenase
VATHEGEHRGYDYLVGADGTASTVRRCLDRPFARDDLILALDYHFDDPRCPPQVALQFLGDGMGYLWLFASREYASAGIGVPATGARVTDLATRVEAFLQTVAPSLDPGTSRKTRWVIPYCRRGFEERYRLQGDGWALIGDAAGLADPMSGEGIYYALKSARLLAEGFLFDRPEDYGGAVERVLRAELAKADGIASDYFRPRILNPLVRVAGWSPSLADFLAGYLTGAASYQTARRDLGRRMGTILGEVVRAPFGGGSGKQFP